MNTTQTEQEHGDGRGTMLATMAAQIAEWKGAAGQTIAEVAAGWVALQRGGHYDARVQLGRERLAFDQLKHRDAVAVAQKKIQELRDPKLPLSDEDRKAIVEKADEILGLN